MINNYYSIPNIPCQERENIVPSKGENQEKCQGLNPDSIFQTLYPKLSNPIINYSIQEDTSFKYNDSDKIKSYEDSAIKCAIDCNNVPECKYIVASKANNVCKLYSATQTEKSNVNLGPYNPSTYRKNELLEGNNSCNVNDNFIKQPFGFVPQELDKPIDTIEKLNLSKEECLSSCAYNNNCNSVLFLESSDLCTLLKNNSGTKYEKNSKAYTKKNNDLPNRFNAPDNLADYYKNYPTSGKEGDSFCEFIEESNQCLTSYIVGKDGNKNVPKNQINPKYIPPNPPCLPPNCLPQPPKDDKIGKLNINGNIRIKCSPGDKQCQNKINQIPYYQTDTLGFPIPSSIPDPANPLLPYMSDYDTMKNLELTSEEMNSKPEITAMDFPEHCENWCNDNPDCGGISYNYSGDGKPLCKYYKNLGEKDLKNSLKPKDGTDSRIKRAHKLIQNPDKKTLDKPYTNGFDNKDILVKKVKKCGVPTSNSDIKIKNKVENFANPEWKQIPGKLKQISVDNDQMCGTSLDSQIYCAYQNINSKPEWKNVPGMLKEISIKNGKAYGVADNHAIYFNNDIKKGNWKNIDGKLTQVSYDGNVVCGIDINNDAFCADNNLEDKPNWFKLNKKLKQVKVNNNQLFGVSPDNQLYYGRTYRTENLTPVSAEVEEIDFDKDVICGTYKNKVKCADKNIGSNPNWETIPGQLKQVLVNNEQLYGLNQENDIFYRNTYKATIPITLKETFTDYGLCPDKKTKKNNSAGTNCPTPFNLKCNETQYGCCPDGQTPKMDSQGKNCESFSKETCINSKNGCCPGTTVPKQYLCDCISGDYDKLDNKLFLGWDLKDISGLNVKLEDAIQKCNKDQKCDTILEAKLKNWKVDLFPTINKKIENGTLLDYTNPELETNTYTKKSNSINICETDFCKNNLNRTLTNCEIQNTLTNDPDAFGDKLGNKCRNKSECAKDQMCVDGFCRVVNPRFYNSINGIKQPVINEKQGFSLQSVTCKKPRPTEVNEECPDKYEPVCGADGITYKNDCDAVNSGTKVDYYGACDVIENFMDSGAIRRMYGRKPMKSYNFNFMSIIMIFGLLILGLFFIVKKKLI